MTNCILRDVQIVPETIGADFWNDLQVLHLYSAKNYVQSCMCICMDKRAGYQVFKGSMAKCYAVPSGNEITYHFDFLFEVRDCIRPAHFLHRAFDSAVEVVVVVFEDLEVNGL